MNNCVTGTQQGARIFGVRVKSLRKKDLELKVTEGLNNDQFI